MIKRAVLVSVGIGLIVLVSMLFGWSRPDNRPHCPQEDSCTIEYREHQWFINGVQVTR